MFDLSKVTIDNFTYLSETTSTIDVIKDMAKKGAEEYTCCLAEVQTKGRGRFQRVWQTYPYKSLAFSFLLYDFQEVVPLVLCCSLHRVLNEKYKAKVAIKWPNDIYYDNKKLSGILVESYPLSNNKRAYVVGIGLNIFIDEDKLDMVGFLQDATSVEISREILLVDLFEQIKKDIQLLKVDGFVPFKQYFMQNCLFVNQEITITNNDKLDNGIFVGINDNGYLILKQKEVILDISAGQIVQEK
ncbi:MAG: Bifunctional ligase/repressor BirA [Proteobacteria bacterium]|nr:MAG: Bifunctional ligase/repressor BirA [Pseudomonadota bacterium]